MQVFTYEKPVKDVQHAAGRRSTMRRGSRQAEGPGGQRVRAGRGSGQAEGPGGQRVRVGRSTAVWFFRTADIWAGGAS